ncbi:hypothetical protein AX16_009259 [Volvariella volvacea WC 439]|nr:hypothetical protein AX16_009259 [Volvariella volvacea WC 439]
MFSRSTILTYFLALGLTSAIVKADVTPSTPGPGAVFNEGSNCLVSWIGDTDSPSNWGNMNIQLMTGDNFNMIHITTVATDLDGTTSGEFSFPCPDVEPNSAIYFYQFTSPATSIKTWTTRFTIAAPDGSTVPPENAVQPGSGEEIPWGVGALVDPSTAVPPPEIGTDEVPPTSSSGSVSDLSGSATPTPTPTPSLPGSGIVSTGAPEVVGEDTEVVAPGTGVASPNPSVVNSGNNSTNSATTRLGQVGVWKLVAAGFAVLLGGASVL